MFSRICSNRDPVSDLVEFLRLSAFLCKKGDGEIDAFSILMVEGGGKGWVNGIASDKSIMKKKKLDLLLRLGQPAVYMGVYIYVYLGFFFCVYVCVCGGLWGKQV